MLISGSRAPLLVAALIIVTLLWVLRSDILRFFENLGKRRKNSLKADVIQQIKNASYITAPFDEMNLIPPFYRYSEFFRVAPKYHLSACHIEKVMTTIVDAIFCFINNATEFTANDRRISTEIYETRFCGDENLHTNMARAREALGTPRVEFAVVRHPISRFLSGFVDKCIREARREPTRCYSCMGDMSCFVSKLASEMMAALISGRTNTPGSSYELGHFSPQTWYCNFKNRLDDYIIIKYKGGADGAQETAKNFNDIFKRAKVPKKLRKEIRSEMLVGKTKHSTFGSSERESARQTLMSNKTLLTQVTELYYYDFIVFDFQLPILI
ncbi:hypothetical protein Q1695_002314 [Nippostrongylus brasiliensis]|nr:hypothetical protein Q1695_002314 [Nippostrongylus brasiliensis]